MTHKKEDAINLMVESLYYKKLLQENDEKIKDLLTVNEFENPHFVKNINTKIIHGEIKKDSHEYHTFIYKEIHLPIRTEIRKIEDEIFGSITKEYKQEIRGI